MPAKGARPKHHNGLAAYQARMAADNFKADAAAALDAAGKLYAKQAEALTKTYAAASSQGEREYHQAQAATLGAQAKSKIAGAVRSLILADIEISGGISEAILSKLAG